MNHPVKWKSRQRLMSALFVVTINIAVLIVCLAAIEFGFRWNGDQGSNGAPTTQWLEFAPFVMFKNPYVPGAGYAWSDSIHGTVITAKIVNNHLGFPMREEVDFAEARPKEENERVVILSGGSAAWGVGATSNEKTVAGRMEAILNERQGKYRYKVFNLAMGGWESVQQLIALALYGRNLQPDWLVSMDGTNDVAIACQASQGAGHTMYYGMMDAYMKAYVFGQVHPVFYRSWLENELVRFSFAYRKLTNQAPVDFDILLDGRDPGIGRSVIRPSTWTDVKRQLELYVQTEGEMVDLFPATKTILSTQALPFSFESMFGRVYEVRGTREETNAVEDLQMQINKIDAEWTGNPCGLGAWVAARNWFMPASAIRLETLANQRRNTGREVHYVNVGALFPNLMVDRNAYFIDPVHLNDAGMDVIGRFYSETILASDLPDQFSAPRWSGQPLPDLGPGNPAPAPEQIRIVEATYGLKCKDFQVAPPAVNRVAVGNATDAVAAACMTKKGKCLFSVATPPIPDPAQGCGKDFSVRWRCGPKRDVYQAYLPGEANGKDVQMSCPAN
jgi:hypothetical protein